MNPSSNYPNSSIELSEIIDFASDISDIDNSYNNQIKHMRDNKNVVSPYYRDIQATRSLTDYNLKNQQDLINRVDANTYDKDFHVVETVDLNDDDPRDLKFNQLQDSVAPKYKQQGPFGMETRMDSKQAPNYLRTLADFTGKNNDMICKKQENPYFFKPEIGYNEMAGTSQRFNYKNAIDTMLSHVEVSREQRNVTPFQPMHTSTGRTQDIRIMPKNVDDLRIKQKAKTEYHGRLACGTGQHDVVRGEIGKWQKNGPEREAHSRPGIATGIEKMRNLYYEELPIGNRESTELKNPFTKIYGPANMSSRQFSTAQDFTDAKMTLREFMPTKNANIFASVIQKPRQNEFAEQPKTTLKEQLAHGLNKNIFGSTIGKTPTLYEDELRTTIREQFREANANIFKSNIEKPRIIPTDLPKSTLVEQFIDKPRNSFFSFMTKGVTVAPQESTKQTIRQQTKCNTNKNIFASVIGKTTVTNIDSNKQTIREQQPLFSQNVGSISSVITKSPIINIDTIRSTLRELIPKYIDRFNITGNTKATIIPDDTIKTTLREMIQENQHLFATGPGSNIDAGYLTNNFQVQSTLRELIQDAKRATSEAGNATGIGGTYIPEQFHKLSNRDMMDINRLPTVEGAKQTYIMPTDKNFTNLKTQPEKILFMMPNKTTISGGKGGGDRISEHTRIPLPPKKLNLKI